MKDNRVKTADYREADPLRRKWMKFNLRLNVITAIVVIITELVFYALEVKYAVFHIDPEVYTVKFLLAPLGLSGICLGLQGVIWFISSNDKYVVYTLSIGLAVTCFQIYTIHYEFSALAIIFVAPILITLPYNDKKLTTSTAVVGFSLEMVSEFLTNWDGNKTMPQDDMRELLRIVVSIIIQVFYYVISVRLLRIQLEKSEIAEKAEDECVALAKEAITDNLTGIMNRAALRNKFEEIMQSEEQGEPGEDGSPADGGTESGIDTDVARREKRYVFVMMDIDKFKPVNDTYGHQKGDELLKMIGMIISENVGSGRPFRYGGDEFCLIFEDTTENIVMNICEKITLKFRSMLPGKIKKLGVDISYGIASQSGAIIPSELVRAADDALYKVKEKKKALRKN